MVETTATMSMTNIFTIGALILNVIMLGIVAYQTWLTRKSLEAANQSITDARTTRQIGLLG
jgi:Tfp pilus assembly protein PilV